MLGLLLEAFLAASCASTSLDATNSRKRMLPVSSVLEMSQRCFVFQSSGVQEEGARNSELLVHCCSWFSESCHSTRAPTFQSFYGRFGCHRNGFLTKMTSRWTTKSEYMILWIKVCSSWVFSFTLHTLRAAHREHSDQHLSSQKGDTFWSALVQSYEKYPLSELSVIDTRSGLWGAFPENNSWFRRRAFDIAAVKMYSAPHFLVSVSTRHQSRPAF